MIEVGIIIPVTKMIDVGFIIHVLQKLTWVVSITYLSWCGLFGLKAPFRAVLGLMGLVIILIMLGYVFPAPVQPTPILESIQQEKL